MRPTFLRFRSWGAVFVFLAFTAFAFGSGIPEPGIVLYGKAYNSEGLMTAGNIVVTYTPDAGGNPVVVTGALQEIEDDQGIVYSYRLLIPAESAVVGMTLSDNVLGFTSADAAYTLSVVLAGQPAEFVDAALATDMISLDDRGKVVRGDVSYGIIPTLPPSPTPATPITPTPVATPTPVGEDTDSDGLPDSCETDSFALLGAVDSAWTNILLPDSDRDGLLDGDEDPGECAISGTPLALTHPRKYDTDGDGYFDGMEVLLMSTDPLDAADPDPGATIDADGDGVPADLDPDDASLDADGDRMKDWLELLMGSDPDDPLSKPDFGNVNNDTIVNNIDAIYLFNYALGNVPSVPNYGVSDINLDGFLNNIDAIVLFNFSLNNVPLLPLR